MKRLFFLLVLIITNAAVNAQVGIGNTNPNASLDISANNPTGSNTQTDGLLIPRIDRERAQSMTGIETSTVIYVNSIATGNQSGNAINIDNVGFYAFNGSHWVKFKQVESGTVINQVMLGSNETNNVLVNTSNYTTISSISYTPVSNNSTIHIEYITRYEITGFGTDDFFSNLTVAGSEITYNYQNFLGNPGGSTRGSSLFPLMGFYVNTGSTALLIEAQARRSQGDDTITAYNDSSTRFKITEVAN